VLNQYLDTSSPRFGGASEPTAQVERERLPTDEGTPTPFGRAVVAPPFGLVGLDGGVVCKVQDH